MHPQPAMPHIGTVHSGACQVELHRLLGHCTSAIEGDDPVPQNKSATVTPSDSVLLNT